MRAQDAGPVRRGRHLAEGGEELRLGCGDERREEGGDAGLEEGVARVAVPVGVGGEEVDSGEAVDLQVDEAGDRDALAVRRREAERRRHGRRGSRRRPRRACRRRGRLRRRASRRLLQRDARCCRPDASSRARAVSASTPARSDTIATRAFPSAPARASSTSPDDAPRRGSDDTPDAILELLVRGDDVDHEVPVRLAEADHRDRRDRVEHELLRGARLEARRSREELRADDDGDLVLDERAELGGRCRDDADT